MIKDGKDFAKFANGVSADIVEEDDDSFEMERKSDDDVFKRQDSEILEYFQDPPTNQTKFNSDIIETN